VVIEALSSGCVSTSVPISLISVISIHRVNIVTLFHESNEFSILAISLFDKVSEGALARDVIDEIGPIIGV